MSDEQTASPADNSAAQQTPDTAALEAQNKELMAQVTQQGQKLAQVSGELEMMRPYVNFGEQQQQAQAEPDYDPDDPEQVLDHKLQLAIGKVESKAQSAIKAVEFLSDNPDLKPYRDRVAYVFGNKTNARKPIDARLADAAKLVREEIKAIEEKAIANHTAAQKSKAAEAAKAQGVMGGHGTSEPSESEKAGETNEEYLAARQKQQASLFGGVGA